jgi:hypothetical protein
MRTVLLSLFLLAACRTPPAWDPVGGFELVTEAGTWQEGDPSSLRTRLDRARARLTSLGAYSATLVTRERIEDELYPRRVLSLRVRENPFAAAIETLEPPSEKGQRVWYDEAQRPGVLLAETPGLLGQLVGRVRLDPQGELAMENRRHAITDTGLGRLFALVERELGPLLGARDAPRVRTIEAGDLHLAVLLAPRALPDAPILYRVGFDDELLTYFGQAELLPDGPALVEEYLYRDLRFEPAFGDEDFRPAD